MAVSVTSNLTLIDAADATTGWSGGTAYSGFQREGTAALGTQASNGSVHLYYTLGAAVDLSNATVFGPWLRSGNPTPTSTGGFRIVLGDGTNRAAFYVGGSDDFGFFFQGWSLFRQDLAVDNVGDEALQGGTTITATNISEAGGGWNYGSKATGNSDNVFLDVIRYISNGTPALVIGGGGSGTEGTWAQVVTQDESTSNAWGVVRQAVPGTKSYQLNFGVDIGNAGTADSYFVDSDFQMFITGGSLTAGNMDVNFLANSTGTNVLDFDNFVIVNVGTVSNWDLSTTNGDTMSFTNGQFVDMGTFVFPPNAANRQVTNTTFTNCGQVTPDTITFTGNTFNGSTNANGAMLLPTSTTNMADLTFNSDGTGHGILIQNTGTYDFDSFVFSGYGADETADAAVYNNSGGAVTINVVGTGNTPTVRNGTGASTTVNNPRTLSITGVEPDSEVRIYEEANPSNELAGSESVDGELVEFEIVNAGSGYTAGDTLTLSGGTFTTAAQITVDTVDGGGSITSASIATPGAYTEAPPNPVSLTGGTGTGATLNADIEGTFSYQYNYTTDTDIIIVVFHLDFEVIRLTGQTLVNSDQSIPVQQATDRVYNNP